MTHRKKLVSNQASDHQGRTVSVVAKSNHSKSTSAGKSSLVNQLFRLRSLNYDYASQLSLNSTSANYYYREAKLMVKDMNKISKAVYPLFKLIDKFASGNYGEQVKSSASVAGNYLNTIFSNFDESSSLLSNAYNLKILISRATLLGKKYVNSKRRTKFPLSQNNVESQIKAARLLRNRMRSESTAVKDRTHLLKSINRRISNKQRNVVKKYHQAVTTIYKFRNKVNNNVDETLRDQSHKSEVTSNSDSADSVADSDLSSNQKSRQTQFHGAKHAENLGDRGSKRDLNRGAKRYLAGRTLDKQKHSGSYCRGYSVAHRGFMARIYPVDNKINVNVSLQYLTGFHFASYFLGGLNDARHRLAANSSLSDNVSYKLGYQAYHTGYVDGIRGHSNPNLTGRADDYKLAYRAAYRKAYRQYLSHFKAGQFAAKNDEVAVKSLSYKSIGYIHGYLKEFRDELSTEPLCLNPLRAIKIYQKPDSRQHASIYPQQERAFKPVFRATDIMIDRVHNLYYRIGHYGYISADPANLARTYYQGLSRKHAWLEVIQPAGTYVYSDKKFVPKNRAKYLRYGAKVQIDSIVSYGGVTRFALGHGKYISSKKQIVKVIKSL